MNYYILPKNNITFDFHYTTIEQILYDSYISRSLQNSLQIIENQLRSYDLKTVEELKQYFNTYEYIFTNVPNSNLSVSKVKPDSNIFYELMEIFFVFNINEALKYKKQITTMHFTPNYTSSIYLLHLIRENNVDNCNYCNFDADKIIEDTQIKNENEREQESKNKSDFLFFEFKKEHYSDLHTYFKNMLVVLYVILSRQNKNGISIVKIDHIFYKWIVDVLYIFTGLYDKVYIIKPYVSNIMTNERYVVCKNFTFISHESEKECLCKNDVLHTLDEIIERMNVNPYFSYSFINNHIPYYFINKIEESNTVIGQQQLETYILLVNILKNKNKDEKLETIKRNHIQKCIQWCEKYKIPHNKFMDKTNIFLNDRMCKELFIQEPGNENGNENENENEYESELESESSKRMIQHKFNIDIEPDSDIRIDDICTNIKLELDDDLDIDNDLEIENYLDKIK
jgi:hypothetical protein